MNFIEEKIIEKVNRGIKPVLRFPPEPNGKSLHLGHAKSMCLNFGLAEKYNGECNLRFDDTNPSAEKAEYVDAIINDIKWLGFTPTRIEHTSNYFETIYGYAVKLIKKGLAYVDDSSSEEIANMKGSLVTPGVDSPYKTRTIATNLDLFLRMRNGEFSNGEKTLRLNIDMASPNMILRDPVIYRIMHEHHHNTGNEWCIYPLYDFAHPISDYIENISDSLCTLEFEVHRPLYNWILENLDLRYPLPEETEFARLNVSYNVMSKRKLKTLVDENYVNGWDDPRLLTLSGLRRKGYTPAAIKLFCETVGYTKRDSLIDFKLLEECLRSDLNKIALRYMVVLNPLKITITNYKNEFEKCVIENNPENVKDGEREVIFTKELFIEAEDFREIANNKYHRLKIGGEVRLKGAYIIKAEEVVKDELGNIIEVKCTYDPTTKSGESDRKVKGTIHWVSAIYNKEIVVNEYENLFTEEMPESFDNIKSSVLSKTAIAELPIENTIIGKAVQFMRNGYFTLDKDGSFIKTVSLKDGFKEKEN